MPLDRNYRARPGWARSGTRNGRIRWVRTLVHPGARRVRQARRNNWRHFMQALLYRRRGPRPVRF